MSEPAMTPWQIAAEDAEEYTQALGQIMSGGWRQIALAKRMGVPQALGMTVEAWVSERIGGYVRLGLDERREAVKELTDPKGEFRLSNREAADVLGIGKDTVRRDLMDGADAPLDDPLPEEIVGAGGASAPLDGWAEASVEPGLADIGAAPPDADEDQPAAPTTGAATVETTDQVDSIPDRDLASAAMAEAAALLDEPEEERAFYLVGRQRFWMRLEPARVADASTSPDQDAPEWEAFGGWCSQVGESLRARARRPVRLVE